MHFIISILVCIKYYYFAYRGPALMYTHTCTGHVLAGETTQRQSSYICIPSTYPQQEGSKRNAFRVPAEILSAGSEHFGRSACDDDPPKVAECGGCWEQPSWRCLGSISGRFRSIQGTVPIGSNRQEEGRCDDEARRCQSCTFLRLGPKSSCTDATVCSAFHRLLRWVHRNHRITLSLEFRSLNANVRRSGGDSISGVHSKV